MKKLYVASSLNDIHVPGHLLTAHINKVTPTARAWTLVVVIQLSVSTMLAPRLTSLETRLTRVNNNRQVIPVVDKSELDVKTTNVRNLKRC